MCLPMQGKVYLLFKLDPPQAGEKSVVLKKTLLEAQTFTWTIWAPEMQIMFPEPTCFSLKTQGSYLPVAPLVPW